MRTLVLLLCCFFAIAGELFSQPWQVLNSGTSANILEVKFINPSIGFITCNDGKIKKTLDGGVSWNVILDQSIVIPSLFFVNYNVGFGAGYFGRIFKTTDAGNTWSVSSPTGYVLRGIYFSDTTTGYVVGDHGCIMKTTNGGANWSAQTPPVQDANLTGIFSGNRGYISVLDPLTSLFYTLDGTNWNDGNLRPGTELGFSVDFNGDLGCLVGYEEISSNYYPLIFKTTNNGQIWSELKGQGKGMIFDVSISPTNSNKICAVGRYLDDPIYNNQGLMMRSFDGGHTWSEEQWPVENMQFRGVYATATDFYVVGYSGVMLKSSHTVGISTINSDIPSSYTLSQNYPNPFNPTTNIEFSLQEKSFVKLKVFDVSGKQITELVNENLTVGTYKVGFDGSPNSSGVYFYTLETEKFTETKRMVLIK